MRAWTDSLIRTSPYRIEQRSNKTMNAHTSGPWRYQIWGGCEFQRGTVETVKRGVVICDIPKFKVTPAHSETIEANARLIAAAPDLLEACRRLLFFNEELATDVHVSTHYPSSEFARAAIAKAEGR